MGKTKRSYVDHDEEIRIKNDKQKKKKDRRSVKKRINIMSFDEYEDMDNFENMRKRKV